MSKKLGINKLMAKRKRQAQERVSFFPANMTLSDVSSISMDEAMNRMFGTNEEKLTLDDMVAQNVSQEFIDVYRERVAELGADRVWATRKANGDLSIRSMEV